MAAFVPETTETFTYVDKTSPKQVLDVLSDLRKHLSTEGPYDGVLAFSEGAALAAMFLIQVTTQCPNQAPPFRVAVFFSGGVPVCPAALARDEIELLSFETHGIQIRIPTVHVWGKNDTEYPHFGPVLRELCEPKERSVFVHEGGHQIPRVTDKQGLAGTVKAIKRGLARADENQ